MKIEADANIETIIDGRKIPVYRFRQHFDDNEYNHIVVLSGRRWFLFLHKKYLNGAKLEDNKILKLSDEEIGWYD